MTENKHRYLNFILIILPIIDLLTSLSSRFLNTNISIGIVIKSAMLMYFVFYIFFLTNSKFKKFSKTVILLDIIFVILYFLTKTELLKLPFLITELSYLFKTLFLQISFLGLINIYNDTGFNKEKMNKILLVNYLLYTLLLLIPIITGSSFHTYIDGSLGYSGWYFSGNEISAIMVLLFPFSFCLIKKNKYIFVILSIISIFIIESIGTKVSLIGIFIACIIMIITTFFSTKKSSKRPLLYTCLIFIIFLGITSHSFSYQNFNKMIEKEPNYEEIELGNMISEEIKTNETISFILKFFSSREIYLLSTIEVYNDNFSPTNLLFGLGFSNTSKIDDFRITKLIEIDILDIFFHIGIVGLLLIFSPLLYIFYQLCAYLHKKNKFNIKIFFFGIMILMLMGISCISGHVFLSPAVSIYLSLYMVLFIDELNLLKKEELVKNKIQILSLHLGYGGAERASVDLANMLCKKYEIEILSLYKTEDKCPYQIDKRVHVQYLTETKPNKDEFINALKNFQIIKMLKEGFKSIKILFLKYSLIRNSILYSDASMIISSRIYFTKILNKNGRKDAKKIAIEHNYDISEKFIKTLKDNCTNIDLLVPVSKTASEEYKKQIDKLLIIHIPNVVSAEYRTKSQLNSKNITYIGRLETVKGSTDLIEVMHLINEKDESVHLDIFGDGSLKKDMEALIEKYNLKSAVTMHGFKNSKEISNALKNSSLLVMTSYKESFGIVILEAFASGIPAIAFTSATGATEIIEDNKNGFLIENRDYQKMSTKIIDYLNLPSSKKIKMSENAISTSELYTYEQIEKQWFETITKLKE